MRYFIDFKYVGTHYHGWQIQPNAHTVQAEMQEALKTLHQEAIELVAAGRTDTGVHAEQMMAHFDTGKKWEEREFIHRINLMLPKDIGVISLRKVKPDFHARFDATSRSYRYQIIKQKDPFKADRAYYLNRNLELDRMNLAADLILGEHDFSCFSKAHTQTFTNNCDITFAEWRQEGELLIFEISANRFLRNMVRAIVGTLVEVGEDKRAVDSIPTLIESKDRSKAGSSVPAQGLFLTKVEYPEEGYLD